MRKISGLLAALTISLSFVSTATMAEELDNYVYNSDGTYTKVGRESAGNTGAGYIEADYGYSFASGSSVSLWGIRGTYGANFGSDWHVQGNLGYTEAGSGSRSMIVAGVHVSRSVTENAALGVFARGGSLSGGGTLQDTYGAEGVIYGEKTTLMATLGYTNVAGANIAGSLSGRYYFTDNARMTAQAAVGENFWSLSAKGSYKLESISNTTLFAGYQYYSNDSTAILYLR